MVLKRKETAVDVMKDYMDKKSAQLTSAYEQGEREELERKIKKIRATYQYSSFFYAFLNIILSVMAGFLLVLGGFLFASLIGANTVGGAWFGSLSLFYVSLLVFDDIRRYSQKNKLAMEDRIKELKESMMEV